MLGTYGFLRAMFEVFERHETVVDVLASSEVSISLTIEDRSRLDGLMRDLGGCVPAREQYTEAPQWEEAIQAFNDYIHHAPDSAFSPPAPELIAIHEALQSVVTHALSRPDPR